METPDKERNLNRKLNRKPMTVPNFHFAVTEKNQKALELLDEMMGKKKEKRRCFFRR